MLKKNKPFLSIHAHSTGSTRDGLQRVEEMCKVSSANNMTFTLTEHGSLATLVEYYKAAKKHGIKFVPGNEIYINKNRQRLFWLRDRIKELKQSSEADHGEELRSLSYEFEDIRKYNHLLVVAKNDHGLKNLFRLNNEAYLKGFYGKPLNCHEDLLNLPRDRDGDRGLIVTTACLASETSQYILKGKEQSALDYCKMMAEEFGDNFYLEIQANEIEEQHKVNRALIEIHKETGAKLAVGTDSHYIDVSAAKAHEIFLLIQGNQKYSDVGKKLWRIEYEKGGVISRKKVEIGDKFHGVSPETLQKGDSPAKGIIIRKAELVNKVWMIESVDLSFKNESQVRKSLEEHEYLKPYVEQMISNNKSMLDKIGDINIDPDIKMPMSETDFTEMKKRCARGLVGKGLAGDKRYIERLKYELDTIERSGFASLFLILQDIFEFARERRIPVNAARGSVGASLVAYCLGLTRIDPVAWDLDFARFCTPERADTGRRVKIQLESGEEKIFGEFDRIHVIRGGQRIKIKAREICDTDELTD